MSKLIHQKHVLLAMGTRYVDRTHHGVAQYAGRHNWHLSNLFGDDPRLIRRRNCDGIIAHLTNDDPLSDAIVRRGIPTVDLSIIRQNLHMPHVTANNLALGRDAARHFLERGFHRFLWYSATNHPAARLRLAGYERELRAHGFTCTAMIVDEAFPGQVPSWHTLSRWIQNTIHAHGVPCAAYAYNDTQAVNLLDACVSGDIPVPDAVAVLGTDNHPHICPIAAVPLSSINHDLEELGRRAAEELDRIMEGEPMERKTIMIPHHGITVRQSTDVFAVNDEDVVRALHFIAKNFHRSVDVAEIVRRTNLSRRTLERRFQEHFQLSILGKLNQLRMQNVCRLLLDTTMPIADIAARCGFNTVEYLHRVFRKQFGTTPHKYRLHHASE